LELQEPELFIFLLNEAREALFPLSPYEKYDWDAGPLVVYEIGLRGKRLFIYSLLAAPQQDGRAKRLESREWSACEMSKLGVPDRYVDAFCGRVPRSVLARRYRDLSLEKLKETYDKAGLKVLS